MRSIIAFFTATILFSSFTAFAASELTAEPIPGAKVAIKRIVMKGSNSANRCTAFAEIVTLGGMYHFKEKETSELVGHSRVDLENYLKKLGNDDYISWFDTGFQTAKTGKLDDWSVFYPGAYASCMDRKGETLGIKEKPVDRCVFNAYKQPKNYREAFNGMNTCYYAEGLGGEAASFSATR